MLHELAASDDDMDEKINDLCEALMLGGPCAHRESKALIAAVSNRPIDDAVIADTAKRIARVRASVEGKEGLSAFLEKRKARWIEES